MVIFLWVCHDEVYTRVVGYSMHGRSNSYPYCSVPVLGRRQDWRYLPDQFLLQYWTILKDKRGKKSVLAGGNKANVQTPAKE